MNLEEAKERTAEAEATAATWREHLAALDAEEVALEASMGKRALDAGPEGVAEIAADVTAVRDRRRTAEAALRAADAVVDEARAAEWPIEAAELRARADAKRAELDALDAATAPLLAELERLQGCRFAPASATVSRPDGTYATTSATTRSDVLRRELHELVGRAFVLEEKAAGRELAVPMMAFEGRPDYGHWGRHLEENRRTREQVEAAAVEAPPKRSLADRVRSTVKG